MTKRSPYILISLLVIFVIFALINMAGKSFQTQSASTDSKLDPSQRSIVDAVSEATRLFHSKKHIPKQMDIKTAFKFWQSKHAIFVDARPAPVYAEAHIPRALNIPVYPISTFFKKFNARIKPNTRIIVYCSSRECEASGIVASYLMDKGYSNVYHMIKGFIEWENNGYPAEGNEVNP